jgi:hypothetical protein
MLVEVSFEVSKDMELFTGIKGYLHYGLDDSTSCLAGKALLYMLTGLSRDRCAQ